MMQLGVIDANDQLIECELDGRVFHVGLSWNEEGQLWSLSARDLNLTVLASGIGCVPNWPLLRQVRRPEFPDGEIAILAPPGTKIDRNSFRNNVAGLFYFSPEDLVYVPPVIELKKAEPYEYLPFVNSVPVILPPSDPIPDPDPDPEPDPDPDTGTGTNPPPSTTPALGTPYFTIASAHRICVVNSQSWPSAQITITLPVGVFTPAFRPTFVANGSGKTAANLFYSLQPSYWGIGNGAAQIGRALTTADIAEYDMNLHWNLNGGGLATMSVHVRVVSETGGNIPSEPVGEPAILELQSTNTYAIVEGQDGTSATVRFVRPIYGGIPILSVVPKNTTATGVNLYSSSNISFLSVINDRWGVNRDLTSMDDGVYNTTIFRNLSDGTTKQIQVKLLVAASPDVVSPAPTPVPTGPQIFFEGFNPGRGTGALVKTYLFQNMVNTPQGTLLIDGADGSAMTPVHPQKANDGTYGFGNGLFEVRARFIGTSRGEGAGPAIILWQADDMWPGSEMDLGELNPAGQFYMAMHRKNPVGGADQSITFVAPVGHNYNEFHTYAAKLEAGRTTFYIDGVQLATSTNYIAPDFASGGVNHTMGIANQGTTTGIEVDWMRHTPLALLVSELPPDSEVDPTKYITLDDGSYLTDDAGGKIDI